MDVRFNGALFCLTRNIIIDLEQTGHYNDGVCSLATEIISSRQSP